ncbi:MULTISPECIES: YoaK family protein [unclassified Streptomyces]|uniref:YoaK family protein n=1 Tax=unclassified Streptomyces TaxID=2593676 RepID=UPI002E2B1710|nr:YoaK family protein [Streptomyces sp. NBC_01429]
MAEELPVARRWAVGALLVMTFATGLVDAVSFLRLGHVFVANMTGNVVFLGFSFARNTGLPVLAPIVAMTAFVLGAFGGGQLSKAFGDRPRHWLGGAFAGQAGGLALTSVLLGTGALRPEGRTLLLIVALLGVCSGLQNATVRLLAPRDLTTTVLTQTLTALTAESVLGAGTGARPQRRIGSVLAMFAGAATGALLLQATLAGVVGLAAVLVAGAACVFALAPEQRAAPPPVPTSG